MKGMHVHHPRASHLMSCSWSMASLSIILVSLFFFFFFFFLHLRHWKRGLPVNWPVVGMLPAILANFHSLHDLQIRILTVAGGTFKFRGPWFMGMDFILACDPANLHHILAANFSNYPRGEDFKEIFEVLGGGIFNANGESWRIQRRMAIRLMSTARFRDSSARCSRSKVYKVLVAILDQAAQLGSVVDLQDVFTRLTFDTACILLSGVDPGCLAQDFPVIPFSTAMQEAEHVLFLRNVLPKIWWKLLRLLQIGQEKRMAMAEQVVDNYIAQIISTKREMKERDSINTSHGNCNADVDDLLTSYMDLTVDDKLDESFRSDKFLRDTILTFLVAAVESTASAMTWFFCMVATHPIVQNKILEELKENLPKLRNTSEDMIEFDNGEIEKLVYLHAAICESLRLFPPVPFNHKTAAGDDVLPSSHKVRRGEVILISHYSMARMEAIWGEDCSEFRPERWILESGRLRHEPSNKFIAFSTGPRACIGKEMALTQIKAVAASIICRFHVRVVDGHVAEPALSPVLHAKNGLKVKLTKREPYLVGTN